MYQVYMIEVSDGTYYTGMTNNLERRLKEHSSGRGSKYVKARLPIVKVLYTENCDSKSAALKREYEIKKLKRKQKEGLCS